eukprot:CAMPEP_0194313312 /NCGR_PEP_ID=MMETSP0171-20130528/10196_1 /TAXON_ID=218684 /ORGANISM="Corethron pennatum, Strain L29A3" /LENGTH=165 /DNA_ID=CAMNT_0039068213 /DNA_START=60 /DNA_END=557 /DNA_ORIENTATION=+
MKMRLLIRRNFGKHVCAAAAALFSATSSGFSKTSYIDKLALILIRDRKQLVARSRGKDVFFTPGGKREPGETDEAALCRECKEELDVDIIRSSISPYGVFSAQAFGKPTGTMVRMSCYSANFRGTLTPSAEVDELKWITSSFPYSELSVTGIMILEDLQEKKLID